MKNLQRIAALGTLVLAGSLNGCSSHQYAPQKVEVYTFEYNGKPAAVIQESTEDNKYLLY